MGVLEEELLSGNRYLQKGGWGEDINYVLTRFFYLLSV